MPPFRKSTGLFDENKTNISVFCGAYFEGSKKCVLLKQRLHIKVCPLCKLSISQGNKPYTKKDLENLPKPGDVAFKVSSFSNFEKTVEEYDKETERKTPVTICIHPDDIV
jgi:hypothetical protein